MSKFEDEIRRMGFDAALANNLIEVVRISVEAGRASAIEECAKVAARWKSSLKPGTEARLLGHREAAREIAEEIRALSPLPPAENKGAT